MDTSNSSSIRNTFAKRLKKLRTARGFKTARAFAEAVGVDENRYKHYERAEIEPNLATLMRICEVLKVTPNDLLLAETSGASLRIVDRGQT